MELSSKTQDLLGRISSETRLGDLRNLAKEIKKDHQLAMELWSTGTFLPRQLAILLMDVRELTTPDILQELDKDMYSHPMDQRVQLMDWLMANQLLKNKYTLAIVENWRNSTSALQRRCYWYYQGRLRWTGKAAPENTPELLIAIEKEITKENPEVQWAMNFTAGWIGIYEKYYRARCIAIGVKTGLYKEERVSRGCTPNYLPEFIAIESKKRNVE